jgi:ComF family protein
MINGILDILFPKKCVGCKRMGSYFCEVCISNILQRELICPQCETSAIGGQTHPVCKKRFGLDGLWSLGIYQPPLRDAIKQLKYARVSDIAPVLVDITLWYWAMYQPFILDKIKKDKGAGWAVVPVPLFWYRENKRGFNQSELFAKLFASKLGLNFINALKRVRYTKFQARLKERERRQNIKNAFEISSNSNLQAVNCALLIDDVWTTGSTMKECTYILKKAGVKQVWGITLAR